MFLGAPRHTEPHVSAVSKPGVMFGSRIISGSELAYFKKYYLPGISAGTPPKFNSEQKPLKNDGWKITFLLGWLIFRGYVKLPGSTLFGKVNSRDPNSKVVNVPPTIGDQKVTNCITWSEFLPVFSIFKPCMFS